MATGDALPMRNGGATDMVKYTEEPFPSDLFWSKVDRSGGADACWEWQACRFRTGYGKIGFHGQTLVSSRVAWWLTYGNPGELCVLHKCDNPPCCNPAHLFLGTQKDNSEDMVSKGRSCTGDRHFTRQYPELVPRGDDHWSRKDGFTRDQIEDIRSRIALGISSQKELSAEYGVDTSTISNIHRGKTYGPYTPPRLRMRVRNPDCWPQRECAECGGLFRAKRTIVRLYCSQECYHKHKR